MKYEEVKLSKPIIELCNSYGVVFEEYEKMYMKYYRLYKSKNIFLYPFKKIYKEKIDFLNQKIYDSYANLGRLIDSI